MANPSASLSCGPLTVKYLVFFFNFIFFISGIVLIIVGAVMQQSFRQYFTFFQDEYKNPATAIIVLGVFILAISFFGCCGSKMENVCMLRVFSFLLAVLLIVELAGGIAVAVMRSDIGNIITKHMKESMDNYHNNGTAVDETWNAMQSNLSCCGTNNYTDWKNTTWSNGMNVPNSCCVEKGTECGVNLFNGTDFSSVYQTGCAGALQKAALKNIGSIVGIIVAMFLIEIVGLWMACSLVNAVQESYEVL